MQGAGEMRVHLWGELGFYDRERRHRFEVTLHGELPLADVLRLLGVPQAEVAIVGLNGAVVRLGDPGVTVGDADRLDLFPPSAGG
jgi:sulfur carrier protein ThiS